ncbi:MAG: hypothetical protein KA803_15140, partial [Rhodoferax sp.]|nr:hypothetical protein [Rhodoferax sp.]
MIHKVPADKLMQQASRKCLVGNALLKGACLQTFEVSAGNSDIQTLVFFESGLSHCTVRRELLCHV